MTFYGKPHDKCGWNYAFQHLLKHPLPIAFRESVLRYAELVYLGSQDGPARRYDRDEVKRHYDRLELK